MAQRHRAAVHVHLVAVEVQVALKLLGDDREGLVHLEEVDVGERHPGAREHLLRGRNRRVEHQRWIIAHIGSLHDPGARLQPVFLRIFF